MEKYNIVFTQQQLGLVVNALAELPYKHVAALLSNIDAQTAAQQQQRQAEAAAAAKTPRRNRTKK